MISDLILMFGRAEFQRNASNYSEIMKLGTDSQDPNLKF